MFVRKRRDIMRQYSACAFAAALAAVEAAWPLAPRRWLSAECVPENPVVLA